MSSYPILNNKPIDQWKVTELKEELRRRKLPVGGLKEALVRKLDEALREEMAMTNDEEMNNTGPDSVVENTNDKVEDDDGDDDGEADDTADINVDETEKDQNDTDDRSSPVNQCRQGGEILTEVNPEFMETETPVLTEEITSTATLSEKTGSTLVEVAAPVFTEEIASSLIVEATPPPLEEVSPAVMEEPVPAVTEETTSSFSVEESVSAKLTVTTDSENAQTSRKDDAHGDLKAHVKDYEFNLSAPSKVERFANQTATRHYSSSQDLCNNEKHDVLKPEREDIKLNLLVPENQVSVVSPELGSQVKSESLPTDSMSIIEKNKLKDNLNANNFHIEQDVIKPEMVQPSSSSDPVHPIGGDAHHSNDDKVLVQNLLSVEEMNSETTKLHDINNKEDSLDVGSPEKLNLDRSSGDESMEEDAVQSKHYEPNVRFQTLGESTEVGKPHTESDIADSVTSLPILGKENAVQEQEIKPTANATEKRKHEASELADKNETIKRQRRWNSETIKVPHRQVSNSSASDLPRNEFQPTPRRTVTSFDQKPAGESPKERIVPPSQNPTTTSLRIDRFLRPFTLKAVQELLGKTGTVCNFWMDHIKTHCYVTYSSVEEAIATRNAVYNLRWPVNGGNLLIAEFVDPKEVKERVEPPQQAQTPITPTPTAPITPSPTASKAPYPQQHQPGQLPARQNSFRQQLPPPPPLPEKERLPPPPAPAKKPEPPPLTLDDLFVKTKATPRIYYLPLTDDQVASKLAAQGRSIKN